MLLLCYPLFLSAVVKLFQLQCCAMVHTVDRHVTGCLRITYVLVQKSNVGTLLLLWFIVCHIHVTSTGAHASLASYTMLMNMHTNTHLSLPPSLPLSLSTSLSPPSLFLSLSLSFSLSLLPPPPQHYLATCLL